jgi:hypothetical protein
MAKLRKGKNPQTVELRKLARKEDCKAGELRHIIEFPKPHALDEVVSDRVVFEVGATRFAIKWTAEIEPVGTGRHRAEESDCGADSDVAGSPSSATVAPRWSRSGSGSAS